MATHPRVFPDPLAWEDALGFIRQILESDRFELLQAAGSHWAILDSVLQSLAHPAGNLFFDLRTVTLMKEHGIRTIYTADGDFLSFSGIDVVNPLRVRE